MTKILLVLTAIIAAGSAIFVLVPRTQNSVCIPIIPVDRSKEVVSSLDRQMAMFASTTVDVMGRSEGGGEQTNYSDNGKLQIVEQRFYGETGRAYGRFYYSDGGALFAITMLNLSYDMPIYVDPSATINASEKKEFYLNWNGTICHWFLHDVEQTVDGDTQDMIREYIDGIL